MFFSISKKKDPRFPNSVHLGTWVFNHDNGWVCRDTGSWFKGYEFSDIGDGNFCEITLDADKIHLRHDIERSFPLYYDHDTKTLTNCLCSGQVLYADDKVCLDADDIVITKTDIFGDISQDPLSMQEFLHSVGEILQQKFLKLQTLPINKKLFLTGGIDTLCLYSQAKISNIDFELVDYEYFAYDFFTNKNIEEIQKRYWGYRQLHHWLSPTFLISGACGDEYTFRGPNTVSLWSAWHDIDILKILEQQSGYHRRYYFLEKNKKIFRTDFDNRSDIKQRYPRKIDLLRQLININLNDHQHWHLGNTLTFTPFKDIEIFKLYLRLKVEDLLGQILDASLTKKFIDHTSLGMLSQEKNYQVRHNLL